MSSVEEIMLLSKVCLFLILLSGLLFGYFYKKIKEKEIYLPTIEELGKKIAQQASEIKKLDISYQELNDKLEKDEEKLQSMKHAFQHHREVIIDKEKIRVELDSKHYTLTQTYQEKSSILNYYNNEMDELKSECRIESVLSIAQDRERLQELIVKKRKRYNQICDDFNQLNGEVQVFLLENKKLGNRSQELAQDLREKSTAYQAYRMKSNVLKREQAEEYHCLKRVHKETQERLQHYQHKIEKLRVSQG